MTPYWMVATAILVVGAAGAGCIHLLLRLDAAVAEELRLTEDDRRWTSPL